MDTEQNTVGRAEPTVPPVHGVELRREERLHMERRRMDKMGGDSDETFGHVGQMELRRLGWWAVDNVSIRRRIAWSASICSPVQAAVPKC